VNAVGYQAPGLYSQFNQLNCFSTPV